MYKVLLNPSAGKDLDKISNKDFLKIKEKIQALEDDPRPFGCVKLTADEGYRIRCGNFRILYRIKDKDKILNIYRVKHRREAYR